MNFGIIGFGRIARKFVKSIEFTAQGKVTAIASKSVSEDDPYLKAHPEVTVFRNYEEMLCSDVITAVYIALPHKEHFQWILAALRHGKAVLCEKPLVISEQEAKEVERVSKETGVLCMEALKTRFNAAYQSLQSDVAALGGFLELHCGFCYQAGESASSYLFEKEQGGAIWDIGSYMLCFVLGLTDQQIVEISTSVNEDQGIDTCFVSQLRFGDGSRAVIDGAIDRKRSRTATIVCREGSIEVPMFNRPEEYTMILTDGKKIHRSFPIAGDDMTMEIEAFIASDCSLSLEESTEMIRILEKMHRDMQS